MIERLAEMHGATGMKKCTSTGSEIGLCMIGGLREDSALK